MSGRVVTLETVVMLLALTAVTVKCSTYPQETPKGARIVMCSLVYSYGDRNPNSTYPKSDFSDPSLWPEGWGHLTLTGMRQHLRFGRWLMLNYGPQGKNLIKKYYNDTEYRVISLDIDRTIMSGLASSAGIYQPKEGFQIAERIQWTPIPIRAVSPDEYDETFAQDCPMAQFITDRSIAQRFKELRRENPDLFDYVEKNSGLDLKKYPEKICWVYDALNVENITFRTLPEWAESVFPHPLRSYAMEFFYQHSKTNQQKRIMGGPLLKTILETMVNKTKHIEAMKLLSYSVNCRLVFSLMNILGVPPRNPPGYTSAVIFELYKFPRESYRVRDSAGHLCAFQVLYRSGPGKEPIPLVMPGCGETEYCLLKTLATVVSHLLPGDLRKECEIPTK